MFISSIDTGTTPMPALLPDQGKERETRSTYLTGMEVLAALQRVVTIPYRSLLRL